MLIGCAGEVNAGAVLVQVSIFCCGDQYASVELFSLFRFSNCSTLRTSSNVWMNFVASGRGQLSASRQCVVAPACQVLARVRVECSVWAVVIVRRVAWACLLLLLFAVGVQGRAPCSTLVTRCVRERCPLLVTVL